MANISEDLIVARRIDNGFSWTLASRLGQMLTKAEAQFGVRDKSFTVLGVEFRDGNPQIWFPGNCGHVVIQLGLPTMQEPYRAWFQLAHECIHLLDPVTGGTNNLEEGVATYFSLEFLQTEFGLKYETGDLKYDHACCLVRAMISIRSDSIKELRQLHGPLRGITEQQILKTCPGLKQITAKQLAEMF